MKEASEARARRGCAAFGAKLYRVRSASARTVWRTNKRDAERHAKRLKRQRHLAVTVHCATLTARMSPKQLAIALLNDDDSAFATMELVQL